MKLQLLAPILVAATTFAPPVMSQSSPNRRVQYFCEASNGIPVTFAHTPKETIEMIRWQSRFFSGSGFTPEERCLQVSARFQKYSNQGTLRFITTGRMNNQNVMCVAESKESGCRADGLIFTFEPKDDPQTVLVEIFNVSTRASQKPLARGRQQRIYIDVNEFLSNSSSRKQHTTQPEATQPVNETPRSSTGSEGSSNNDTADTCTDPNSIFCY